jgi:hypothetical protein
MRYKGSCHSGKVAFEVEGELEGAVACNCSICSRKGALLWAVPRDQLRLLTPEDGMGRYTFNNHVIEHRFCRTCGMHPYAEDVEERPNSLCQHPLPAGCRTRLHPGPGLRRSFDVARTCTHKRADRMSAFEAKPEHVCAVAACRV